MNKLLLVLLISIPTVASCDSQSSGKSNGAASERGGKVKGKIDLKLQREQEQAAKAFERAANATAHPPPNGTNPRPTPPPPPALPKK